MSDRGERSDTSKSDPTLTGVFRKFPESPDSPRRIEDTSDSTDESAMMELTGEIQQIRWNIQQIERKEKGYQMDWTRRTYNRSDTMLQSRIFALVRSFRSFRSFTCALKFSRDMQCLSSLLLGFFGAMHV